MGKDNQELTSSQRRGKAIAEIGAAGLAIGIILGFIGDPGGLTNVLTFGGLAVALVGWVLWRRKG